MIYEIIPPVTLVNIELPKFLKKSEEKNGRKFYRNEWMAYALKIVIAWKAEKGLI